MAVNPQLLPIELDSDRVRKNVLRTITLMLTNRYLLDINNLAKNINTIPNMHSDESMYTITLDETSDLYNNDKVFYVKIINQKVSSISKGSIIGEFLNQYKSKPKIVVVNNITTKAKDQLHEFPHTELFLEKELMMNIIDHIAVPPHILLTQEEADKVCEEYDVKKQKLPKIFDSDPIARYYNAKPDDIFKIIRPSETTGQSVYYRRVVHGNITLY